MTLTGTVIQHIEHHCIGSVNGKTASQIAAELGKPKETVTAILSYLYSTARVNRRHVTEAFNNARHVYYKKAPYMFTLPVAQHTKADRLPPMTSIHVFKLLAKTNIDAADALMQSVAWEMQYNPHASVMQANADMVSATSMLAVARNYIERVAVFEGREQRHN